MKKKYPLLLFLLVLVVQLTYSQRAAFFHAARLPAESVGGDKEVQMLFDQSMIYPEKEYADEVGCEIFVLFKVNNKGNIYELSTTNCDSKLIQEEAKRLVNLIVWEKNPERIEQKNEIEKIQIDFSPKKYSKLIKKRKKQEFDPVYFTDFKYYSQQSLDEQPRPENYASINEFVSKNMKYPSLALQQGISGKVKVRFIIEPYGRISNVKIVEAVAGGCNEETVRLLRSINWIPGKVSGEDVRTVYEYSLTFNHPGGTFR